MGNALARRLLSAGFAVTVYNRTQAKSAALAQYGADVAQTPAALAAGADVLILTLAEASAIEAILFAGGAVPMLRDKTVIQMGTITPDESRALLARLGESGGAYLEAPVLGSIPEVEHGALITMVGARSAQFAAFKLLFETFSKAVIWVGPVGQAAVLKLALNQLIASLTAAFALSLGYVQHAGVEVEHFMQVLRESALYAPTFDKKLERMLKREFAHPNFPLRHLLKDLDLFIQSAQAQGLNTTTLTGLREMLARGSAAQGDMVRGGTTPGQDSAAEADYSGLYNLINPPR